MGAAPGSAYTIKQIQHISIAVMYVRAESPADFAGTGSPGLQGLFSSRRPSGG